MDAQAITSFILGVATLLLGGLNIFQLLTFRAYKRKTNAEADKSEIEALRAIIDANTAELGRLQQRIETEERRALEQENKYNRLYDQYITLREEFNDYKLTHK